MLALPSLSFAQINVLSVAPPQRAKVKLGGTGDGVVALQLRDGYHVNSNAPADQYLIPLKLTWTPGQVEAASVDFPKPQSVKLGFSEKPVLIFSNAFQIVTHFKTTASATPGLTLATGKLRYQACNDKMCLAPKTVDVTIPVEISK
ncbi:MAG: protein-disulfide reductase DsbD domain-containing protein [Bryobacteraceae bacterium]